ncbi:hypothetical protein QCA50_004301 [Cerrena zonata]|uniref:Uncharacterized protein n=1 Tax=Cerrena zonata TaxID=2478898 RepID=A0AAW0GGG1_9APHY
MSVLSGPLLSRRSLRLALTLAPSFIATGAQSTTSTSSSASPSHSQSADDEDTDDDGEDGDNSSTRTHSSTRSSSLSATSSASASATATTISDGSSNHGLQAGSIVAIVFGILVLLLILGALLLFWWRRRRRQLAATSANGNDGSQVNTALISKNPVSIPSPTHPHPSYNSWIPPVYMAAPVSDHGSDPEHGDQSQEHHRRASSSIHTLPNPHDSYRDIPQSRTSTMRTSSMLSDRDLPPLPDSPISLRPTSTASSLFGTLSTAPSSFPYPVLSQVPESESVTSANSVSDAGPSLTSTGAEAAIMADYQKRLETHHRKESEDAVGGSGIPVDPPPRYSESDHTHQP